MTPEIRDGIIATARAVGADPVDLATVLSYETAGTFDPTKAGPTTQWGQHRGLIQFGEPQAQQYGVDWNNPVASQLGPDGAIAKYLRASGFKPGMGLLDLYSTVNAGAPGLYSRSDANNGGAPGTVADKVLTQMGGHRQKAVALLGGEGGSDMPRPDMPSMDYAGNGSQQPQSGPQGREWSPQWITGPEGINSALYEPEQRNALALPQQAPTVRNALAADGFQAAPAPLQVYGFQPGQSPFLRG